MENEATVAAVVVEAVEGRLLLVAGARGCGDGADLKYFYYQKKLVMGELGNRRATKRLMGARFHFYQPLRSPTTMENKE